MTLKPHLKNLCSRSTQKILLAASALATLAGCRVYEPQRYDRIVTAADTQPLRVLMIGDSLTYYNDLPGLLQQFSAHESRPIYIEKITFPLRPLKDHWDLGEAPKRIREGHWDYVILQDFSRKPVTDPQDCIKYYQLFNDEITRAGAQTIIFENWTRKGKDDEFPLLMNTYNTIAATTHAIPAPIGQAFRETRAARPDIPLILDDRHPSNAGSYLIAAVLYDVLYHKNSADLPWDLLAPKLPRETLAALRTFADQATAPSSPPN